MRTEFWYSTLYQNVMAARVDSENGILTRCVVSPETPSNDPLAVMRIVDFLKTAATPEETRKAEEFFK